MRSRLPGLMAAVVLMFGSPAAAIAGGTCLLHPKPFTLRSDTIRWAIKVKPGQECIQGLRWSTIMIDKISIAEAPKSGRVEILGPSFRYFASPSQPAADSFKIAIEGTSLHVKGSSTIEVDVSPE